MKEFRKNEHGLFICEECRRTFISKNWFGHHINKYHNSKEEYYNKWIKEGEEGICKKCGNKVNDFNFKTGYVQKCEI
jgi:hypothetical protein